VKAAPESKIKIFLEGRYFGTAPLTIYSVPKGDYIVEAVYSNGKQVSRPVSVGENEETAVDLGGAQALRAASGPGMFEAEMTPTRMTVTKVGLVVAGRRRGRRARLRHHGAQDESDYEKAVGQQDKDDLEQTGNRWALFTNLGLGLVGAGLIVAGIAGYPLVLKPSEKTEDGVHLHPHVTPRRRGGAALTVRF
jgi:hypothetical protein